MLLLPWPRVLVDPVSEYHWLCTGRVELVFGESTPAEVVAQIRYSLGGDSPWGCDEGGFSVDVD